MSSIAAISPTPSLPGIVGGKPRVAVVTGSSRGIGAATARRLSAVGFAVVINYLRNRDQAEMLAREITATNGHAIVLQADVSKREEAHSLIEATVDNFGRIDVLVNNAGTGEFAPLRDLREDSLQRQIASNLGGPLWCTQAAVERFDVTGGRVINISSSGADHGPPTSTLYAASKAALESMTQVLANELGPKGITVNAVAPGPIVTELYVRDMEHVYLARTPLGRVGQTEDVAGVVAFLASPDAAWITGQVITVAGGFRW